MCKFVCKCAWNQCLEVYVCVEGFLWNQRLEVTLLGQIVDTGLFFKGTLGLLFEVPVPVLVSASQSERPSLPVSFSIPCCRPVLL